MKHVNNDVVISINDIIYSEYWSIMIRVEGIAHADCDNPDYYGKILNKDGSDPKPRLIKKKDGTSYYRKSPRRCIPRNLVSGIVDESRFTKKKLSKGMPYSCLHCGQISNIWYDPRNKIWKVFDVAHEG
jgi:hypothetical protein